MTVSQDLPLPTRIPLTSVDWPACETVDCTHFAIAGWGPTPLWLCQPHYEDLLDAYLIAATP